MSKKEVTILKNDVLPKFVIESSMQKGNITFESEVGKGTTFIVTLPL